MGRKDGECEMMAYDPYCGPPIQEIYDYIDGERNYLRFMVWPGGNVEITDIVVNSDRRKGKGTELLNALVNKLKEWTGLKQVVLTTRTSNLIAREFYTARGFNEIGTLKLFYRDTMEDGIVYGRQL